MWSDNGSEGYNIQNPLIAIKTKKTLTKYSKKVDLLNQLSDRVEFWTIS